MASCRLPGKVDIFNLARVSLSISSMFLSEAGGGCRLFRTPSSPAASITEKAKYGLQAGSGDWYSSREDHGCVLFSEGIRIRSDPLTRAHDMYMGASYPGTSRL